jgi:uncharacterized pyridoxamine 5'-phosphate oxidase family protein
MEIQYHLLAEKQEEIIMFDYQAVLKENPHGVLATTDGGKVATRVFQYLFSDGNKAYFCTSSEKPVYAQLQANPCASFCTYPADFAPVVSVNGKAVFVDDMVLKTRALDENPGIKGLYNTPENPVFKLFYIDVEAVETFSFAEGPKTIKF